MDRFGAGKGLIRKFWVNRFGLVRRAGWRAQARASKALLAVAMVCHRSASSSPVPPIRRTCQRERSAAPTPRTPGRRPRPPTRLGPHAAARLGVRRSAHGSFNGVAIGGAEAKAPLKTNWEQTEHPQHRPRVGRHPPYRPLEGLPHRTPVRKPAGHRLPRRVQPSNSSSVVSDVPPPAVQRTEWMPSNTSMLPRRTRSGRHHRCSLFQRPGRRPVVSHRRANGATRRSRRRLQPWRASRIGGGGRYSWKVKQD